MVTIYQIFLGRDHFLWSVVVTQLSSSYSTRTVKRPWSVFKYLFAPQNSTFQAFLCGLPFQCLLGVSSVSIAHSTTQMLHHSSRQYINTILWISARTKFLGLQGGIEIVFKYRHVGQKPWNTIFTLNDCVRLKLLEFSHQCLGCLGRFW